MLWIRAKAAGLWRTVDIVGRDGLKLGERHIAHALERNHWCVDRRSVEVDQGLVVSFSDWNDVEWFLKQRRAAPVQVEVDSVVWFENDDDAMFFVRMGLAALLGEREVQALYAAQNQQQDEGDQHVQAEDGKQGAAEATGKQEQRKGRGARGKR